MYARGTKRLKQPLIVSDWYGVHRTRTDIVERLSQPSQECARATPPAAIPFSQETTDWVVAALGERFRRPGNDAGPAGRSPASPAKRTPAPTPWN